MKRLRLLITIAFFLLAITSYAQEAIKENKKSIILNEAKTAKNELFDAFSVMDSTKVYSCFSFDDDFRYLYAGMMLNSEETLVGMSEFFKHAKNKAFTHKSENYIVLNKELVLYQWHGGIVINMKSGEAQKRDDVLLSFLFQKIKGQWKVIAAHES